MCSITACPSSKSSFVASGHFWYGGMLTSCQKHICYMLSVRGIIIWFHFRKNDLLPVISCLTSLTFWSLFHAISIPFCPKSRLGPKFLRFPNTFHFSGTLLPSCVNRKYNSNVTGCLSYLKILHYKMLQDACHFCI